MAEPKRRDRPKGAEIRDSLKPKKPVPALPDRFTEQDMRNIRARQIPSLKESAQGVLGAAVAAEATDPFLERNEFKEGFYDQISKPATSYETLKGTAAKPIPNITDTESFADGGSVRGQKAIQVKKKQFRGVF
jgi:hypothetical protein